MDSFRSYFNKLRYEAGEMVLFEGTLLEPQEYLEESIKLQVPIYGSNINHWNDGKWDYWNDSPAGPVHITSFIQDKLLIVIMCSGKEVMFCTNNKIDGYTNWKSITSDPGFSITAKRSLPYGTTAKIFGSVFGLVANWMKTKNIKSLSFSGASEGLKNLYGRILKNKSVMSQLDNMGLYAHQNGNIITVERKNE